MKSIEDQIKFVDKVLLPFFSITSIIDYDSTFEITSEIDLNAFNLIISDFREIFPAKEFSLHKTKYKIETSNQALCLLKKCMDLIQLPYTIETITKNKISFKQLRLNQTNSNLYKYIQFKMSEIRSQETLLPKDTKWWEEIPSDSSGKHLINIYRPIGINTINTTLKSKSLDIRGGLNDTKPKYAVSPWQTSSYEPDSVNLEDSSGNLPIGVNTINSSLKTASYDIRGTPPNPKYVVSPWGYSSCEPDSAHDLKPPKVLPITLSHDDLLKAVESEVTHITNLSGLRSVDKDGVCTINLKCCDFYDKYINSIKCSFESQKMNDENIMSKYFIDSIVQGAEYIIYIGGNELLKGTFYNNKELLPEGGDSSKQMFLCNKILSNHEAFLKIKFCKESCLGLKFIDIQLTTVFANLKTDIDESLVETALNDPFMRCLNKKKHNVCGLEQLIRNEKQLWNKARLMYGMHGNAYVEFIEKDHMDKLSKEFDKLQEKKPKQTVKKGNLNGYINGTLEVPVDDYHFCCTSVLKKYSQFDNVTLTYTYKKIDDNTFVHRYEFQYEKQNMFRYGENNPRDIYGVGDIVLMCDNIIDVNAINLYAIMIKKTNTIEIQKVQLECCIKSNDLYVHPTQYLCVNSNKEFRGFLFEVLSESKNDPLPNLITLEYNEYSFCSDIRRQLAQHDVTLFDLNKVVAK